MRIREDVADVERAADGGRRRIDRVDLASGTGAIEPVDLVGLPARHPFLFESFEGGALRNGNSSLAAVVTRA